MNTEHMETGREGGSRGGGGSVGHETHRDSMPIDKLIS